MKKSIISLLSILILLSSIFSTGALAKTGDPHKSIVALGDSITAGYNLENPMKNSFPSVIAQRENWELFNLGIPGARTDHLLTAIQTREDIQGLIREVNYITLNIGSNDLLQAYAEAQRVGNPFIIQRRINEMFGRLGQIIELIQLMNPDAEIVLYNIYNAFQVDHPMYQVSETLLPSVNGQYELLASNLGLGYVDAYTTYDGKQAQYLLRNDIHPNEKGQKELAKIGSEAFRTLIKSGK
jgi:lysophospholipase L1-like esterase